MAKVISTINTVAMHTTLNSVLLILSNVLSGVEYCNEDALSASDMLLGLYY